MDEPRDEISLRELYLVFRNSLVWVLGVSIVVAIGAYVAMKTRPVIYQAHATVQAAPVQFNGKSGNALDLASVTQVDFETYHAIATSTPVVNGTLHALQAPPSSLTPLKLVKSMSVRKIAGGSGQPLVVSQTVGLGNGKLAAEVANAWAQATASAVRTSATTNLQTVIGTLKQQATKLQAALNSAEANWADFQKTDDRASLQAQLTSLDSQTTDAQQRLLDLDRNAAQTKARQQMLEAVVKARQQGTAADVQSQVAALTSAGVLSNGQGQALANAIASVPGGSQLASQDIATVVARTQLQQSAQDLAGYVAERQAVQSQLAGFAKKAASVRARLASLTQQADQLHRALTQATNAYNEVANTTPTGEAAAQLLPAMVTVVSSASAPLEPVHRKTAAFTGIAFVVAFLLMTLLAFLRAAVAPEGSGFGARGAESLRSGDPHERRENADGLRHPTGAPEDRPSDADGGA